MNAKVRLAAVGASALIVGIGVWAILARNAPFPSASNTLPTDSAAPDGFHLQHLPAETGDEETTAWEGTDGAQSESGPGVIEGVVLDETPTAKDTSVSNARIQYGYCF